MAPIRPLQPPASADVSAQLRYLAELETQNAQLLAIGLTLERQNQALIKALDAARDLRRVAESAAHLIAGEWGEIGSEIIDLRVAMDAYDAALKESTDG